MDGRGTVTPHAPESGTGSVPLAPAGTHALPGAYALDDAPGFERFFLVTAGSDIQLTHLAVKFGGKYLYTALLGGIGPDDRLERFSLGLGLGLHLPLGERMWLDGDVAGSTVLPARRGALPAHHAAVTGAVGE